MIEIRVYAPTKRSYRLDFIDHVSTGEEAIARLVALVDAGRIRKVQFPETGRIVCWRGRSMDRGLTRRELLAWIKGNL
jgi:hypothetical protein